jgi:hypothetical protein
MREALTETFVFKFTAGDYYTKEEEIEYNGEKMIIDRFYPIDHNTKVSAMDIEERYSDKCQCRPGGHDMFCDGHGTEQVELCKN